MISLISKRLRFIYNEAKFVLVFPWAKSIHAKLSCIQTRSHIPRLLTSLGLTGAGVELGVREGIYSYEILARSRLRLLYSIDRWAGDAGHDEQQMRGAMDLLSRFGKRSAVIKASFSDAVKNFKDECLDFIYIDGYAEDGQNDGETLKDWWPKLKSGGVFSGHDYHPLWERNVRAVSEFVEQRGLSFCLTSKDEYPSWIIIKPF